MKISACKNLKKIIISVFIYVSSLNVHAAIIDFGSYFSDTSSGLFWMDVTPTVNRSFNDVSSQFGASGDFSGWRYATGSEFDNLLFSWTGVPRTTAGRTETTNTSPSVDGLVVLFGSTLDTLWVENNGKTWDNDKGYDEGQGIDFTQGILADFFNNNASQRQVGALWDNENNGTPLDFYNSMHRQVSLTNAQFDIGSFLVRTDSPQGAASVGEPQSFILLCLGLIGLGFSRRKMKFRQVF